MSNNYYCGNEFCQDDILKVLVNNNGNPIPRWAVIAELSVETPEHAAWSEHQIKRAMTKLRKSNETAIIRSPTFPSETYWMLKQ